jgi:isopenicillin N synthase-like dioxygenase
LTENYFVDRHRFMFQDQDKNATTFRTLYYPSLSESDIQPGVVRCGAHSDYGTITLLLQDSVGGLEVFSAHLYLFFIVFIIRRLSTKGTFRKQMDTCYSDPGVNPCKSWRSDAILDFGSLHCNGDCT